MKEYKGYYIKPNKTAPQLVQIVTTGRGGKIPSILSGLFTSHKAAMDEIDRYVDRKENGKTVGKSRS